MHSTNIAPSSRGKGFSLAEVSVVLGIISILTMGVCWTLEQTTRVMRVTEARVRTELPHVIITAPSGQELPKPENIVVAWTWWEPYPSSSDYPPIQYATLYSRDGGRTWRNMRDDSTARPGEKPSDLRNLTDRISFGWDVPAEKFPEGNYTIRLEAFGDEVPQHYAYDQHDVLIKR